MIPSLTNNMYIAGLPAFRIRHAFKAAGAGRHFVWPLCAEHLCVGETKAQKVCDQLVKEGYLDLAQDVGSVRFYRRTLRAKKLVKERVPDPLLLPDALALFGQFVEGVQRINHDAGLRHRVANVELLGEMLNKPVVPHIELGISIASKSLTATDEDQASFGSTKADSNDSRRLLMEALEAISPSICLRFH